jgi:hypothetical protein
MPFVVGKLPRNAPCQRTLLVLVPPLLADVGRRARHGRERGEALDGTSLTPLAAIWRAARKQDERARCGGG